MDSPADSSVNLTRVDQTSAEEASAESRDPAAGIDHPEIGTLVEQFYSPVFRFAYRLSGQASDAEDLAQQAFMDAQRKLHTLRDPEKARPWLFMIVRNLYRRKIRDQKPNRQVTLEAVAEPTADVQPGPLDHEGLQAALDNLPEEFRTVLLLFYFEELSYREIAVQLDLPIGTVMSRLSRGKQHLRQRLSPEDV
ncbi:MAG: RNA polymerase sigma factor [Planctomycetota bacterium]|nr:RNA polymerase sigma factor [Planctomycetota bacterium]MDA1252415.1 RNA polymerase sigma factor [Planctomycetota bacterium]